MAAHIVLLVIKLTGADMLVGRRRYNDLPAVESLPASLLACLENRHAKNLSFSCAQTPTSDTSVKDLSPSASKQAGHSLRTFLIILVNIFKRLFGEEVFGMFGPFYGLT